MTQGENPRVCFISLAAYHYFNSDAAVQGGGAQRQLYLLSQELKSSFDIHFIVGDYGQPATEVQDGITLHRSYKPNPDSSTLKQIKRTVTLFDTVRKVNADFYFFRGFPTKAGVLNVYFELLRTPWLYSLSSDDNLEDHVDQQPSPLTFLFERAMRNVGTIVSQTEYQSEQVVSQLGIDSLVIPNGYPPAEMELPWDNREFFLWVGNIDEAVKRPHLFLDVAARIPDVDFIMIGPADTDPEYHKRIEQRSTRLDNVKYLGPVDPSEIHSYFKRAKALINTSPKEGFPNTFLEAWRYATPVLGLDVAPSRFVDFPNQSGYMDGDIDRLVESVDRLSTDDTYWSGLSEPAKQYFEDNFTIDQIAMEYKRIIENGINK